MNNRDSYDKIYQENACVFGFEPSPIVDKVTKYITSGKVVDLGAGEGRNSLFLAKRGFEVTAIDNSNVAIEKMSALSSKEKVKLNTLFEDVLFFDIPKNHDVIVAVLLFHHFSNQEVLKLIAKMKNATSKGGLHVFDVITKQGDFYKENLGSDKFYIKPGELRELYKDWEILEFGSIRWQARRKNLDGNPIFNTSEIIIARKIN